MQDAAPALLPPLLSQGYLELLLSSVVKQHQLLVLLTADERLPGRCTLPSLQRQRQRQLGLTQSLCRDIGEQQDYSIAASANS